MTPETITETIRKISARRSILSRWKEKFKYQNEADVKEFRTYILENSEFAYYDDDGYSQWGLNENFWSLLRRGDFDCIVEEGYITFRRHHRDGAYSDYDFERLFFTDLPAYKVKVAKHFSDEKEALLRRKQAEIKKLQAELTS